MALHISPVHGPRSFGPPGRQFQGRASQLAAQIRSFVPHNTLPIVTPDGSHLGNTIATALFLHRLQTQSPQIQINQPGLGSVPIPQPQPADPGGPGVTQDPGSPAITQAPPVIPPTQSTPPIPQTQPPIGPQQFARATDGILMANQAQRAALTQALARALSQPAALGPQSGGIHSNFMLPGRRESRSSMASHAAQRVPRVNRAVGY